jgi:hypothetical protein
MTGVWNKRFKNGGTRAISAICALVLGLMVLGFYLSSSLKGQASQQSQPQMAKKLPAWNIALGDLVILARDLGFSVSSTESAVVDESQVAARIEGQLQRLREFYRDESARNEGLMGELVLQLSVTATGEVSNVREISSRIADGDFRKAVVDEVASWSFDQVLSEEATIVCPLLFVREGMDVTTLIRWERSLAQSNAKKDLAKTAGVESVQPPTPRAAPKPQRMPARPVATALPQAAPAPPVQPVTDGSVYQMKYSTAIRKEPKFSATAVARFSAGTKVFLLGKTGDWYEVRQGGWRGFLRKEFVAPAVKARNDP